MFITSYTHVYSWYKCMHIHYIFVSALEKMDLTEVVFDKVTSSILLSTVILPKGLFGTRKNLHVRAFFC